MIDVASALHAAAHFDGTSHGRERWLEDIATALAGEIQRLRSLIEQAVIALQHDDGEQVHVASEPDSHSKHIYTSPDGMQFDLRPPFHDDLWARLVAVAFPEP